MIKKVENTSDTYVGHLVARKPKNGVQNSTRILTYLEVVRLLENVFYKKASKLINLTVV